jgi:outer membrane receptor protein involved in Fe transport
MSLTRSGLALAAIVVSLPLAADESVFLDAVQVTATRAPVGSFAVPQPVTVLDAEEIAERTPQVAAELLRGQAGVFFQQTGPGQGMAIVRGLKGSEVLHLVDGFRLNNAFFRAAPSQYIALIDSWNIHQLEVLRGPYATLYGTEAMGGVVQITTPETRFESDTPGWVTKATGHYASADLARVARLSHAIGNRRFSLAAGATTAHYGNRDTGGPAQAADGFGNIDFAAQRAAPTSYEARSFDVKALLALTPHDELMLSVQRYGVPEGFPRYNEVVPGSRPIVAGENPARFVSLYLNDRELWHVRYRRETPLGFVDRIELHLGRQIIEDDRFDRFRPNPTTLREQREFNRSTLDGLTAAFVTARGAHTLRYGFELYQDEVDSRILRSNNGGAFMPSSATSLAFKSRFPNGASTENLGAYVSDAWQASEKLLLEAGLRANHTETRVPGAPTSDRAKGFAVSGTDTTAQFGLRYALTPQLAAVANAGSGFRAPNINDLAAVGSRSGNRFVVSNPELKAETIHSADLGLKFAGQRFAGELVGFYALYEDRIDLVNNAVARGSGECPAMGETSDCSQNRNIQEAQYYGLEAALRYRPRAGVVAYATLNAVRSDRTTDGITEPGNRIPPVNGLVGVEWQPAPRWVLEPSVWLNAAQRRLDSVDRADNRIPAGGSPGFAVVNLRAAYAPAEGYRVQLFGENLLDKAYREHGSGIDGRGRGVGVTAEATF